MAQLTLRKQNCPGWTCLLTKAFKKDGALPEERLGCERGAPCEGDSLLLALKMKKGICKKWEWPLRTWSSPWLTASMERGTSVLLLQETGSSHIHMHLEEPEAPDEHVAQLKPWFYPWFETLSRGPSHAGLDFWLADHWDNKWVLSHCIYGNLLWSNRNLIQWWKLVWITNLYPFPDKCQILTTCSHLCWTFLNVTNFFPVI